VRSTSLTLGAGELRGPPCPIILPSLSNGGEILGRSERLQVLEILVQRAAHNALNEALEVFDREILDYAHGFLSLSLRGHCVVIAASRRFAALPTLRHPRSVRNSTAAGIRSFDPPAIQVFVGQEVTVSIGFAPLTHARHRRLPVRDCAGPLF